MLNLGNINYTMKPFCGNGCNNPAPHSYLEKSNSVSFCGVREEFSKKFTKTQKEVVDEFVKRLKETPIRLSLPLFGLSTKDEIEAHFDDIMLEVGDAIDRIAKEMKGGSKEWVSTRDWQTIMQTNISWNYWTKQTSGYEKGR